MAVNLECSYVIVDGAAEGVALVTDVPLSFWGGVDPVEGRIIDRRHPLDGEVITGRILVLPSGRGSCSASGVLLEAIANQTAPLAIIVSEIDPIIGLGAILAEEILERTLPVLVVPPDELARIADGTWVRIASGGVIEID